LPPALLILDPDTAFATVLAEAIEGLGTYQAVAVASLDEALAELRARDYAMVLVDPTALEVPPPALAERLRAVRPGLRLMWIGEEDSEGAAGVEVQGWLPKPFFVGELPVLLDEAMRKPYGRPAPPPPPAPPEGREDLKDTLRRLCQETGILCAFVLAGDHVLAHAGTLAPTALDPLSRAAVGMERSLQQVAQAISEEGGFQQVILEGAGYRLYLVRVTPEATLAILGESAAPLGALRYSARQAARELASFLSP
jgi:predicted regulator of Ras-like GTPase activity (Roadblock/LC7/MglB family)